MDKTVLTFKLGHLWKKLIEDHSRDPSKGKHRKSRRESRSGLPTFETFNIVTNFGSLVGDDCDFSRRKHPNLLK